VSKGNIPLFNFGYHDKKDWLEKISKIAKEEPWGQDRKVLELYLRANFEIAKQKSKVYENEKDNKAFWKAGYLVNDVSDPIWLVYDLNKRDHPKWHFKEIYTGECPIHTDDDDFQVKFQVKYEPPEFNSSWKIYFNQKNLEHMLKDSANQRRLFKVFGDLADNAHLIFRVIYGEVELKRKEEIVIPQWYYNDYQFLMPLYLTQPNKVELAATLTPNSSLGRYEVNTLLLPHYSYAYARSVVKSRASFANWMLLTDEELNQIDEEEE